MLERFVPKNFLWRYPLTTGAYVSAGILLCVTFICGIALVVQVLLMNSCEACSQYVWRNAYSFSISGVIYCIIMLVMHAWLIWGVAQKKSTVLLAWLVITTVWLFQTLFLLIILICIHSSEVNFIAWTLALLSGIVSIGILLYLVLVVYGLWIELKKARKTQNIIANSNN